jgi:hypothetical protein
MNYSENHSEQGIVADWSRLGITWNVPPARRTPDVELLVINSLDVVPANPRMLVLMASWLAIYWRCVGRDRLLSLARKTTPRRQATLGLLLETVNGWEPVFGLMIRQLQPLETGEPLLDHDRGQASLTRLAELEASAISKRWGVWCQPIERRDNAIRPPSWVFRVNPSLRLCSLFKGSLKASLLSAIAAKPGEFGITSLATQCGVTRKAVYEAVDDLIFSELVSKDKNVCTIAGVGMRTRERISA